MVSVTETGYAGVSQETRDEILKAERYWIMVREGLVEGNAAARANALERLRRIRQIGIAERLAFLAKPTLLPSALIHSSTSATPPRPAIKKRESTNDLHHPSFKKPKLDI